MLPVGSLGFTPMLFSVPLRLRVSPQNSMQCFAKIGRTRWPGSSSPIFSTGGSLSQRHQGTEIFESAAGRFFGFYPHAFLCAFVPPCEP